MTEVAIDSATAGSSDVATRVARLARRSRDFATGASIRTKILGIVVSLTLIMGLGFTFQVRSVMSSVLVTELDRRAASVAGDVAGRSFDAAAAGDFGAVRQVLADMLTHNPDAVYGYMTGPGGETLAQMFRSDDLSDDLEFHGETTVDSGMTHTHATYGGSEVHQFEAEMPSGLGSIHVGFGENRISEVIDGMTTQMLVLTLLVAAVGVAAAGLLTWMLTRPILDLVETTRQVGEGDLSARSRHRASDEIGSLARSFNEMVEDLERSKDAIDRNERARTHLIDKLIGAQEEERQRLARGLHDTIGQSLSSIGVGIALLGKLDTPASAAKSDELQRLVGEAQAQVREMSRELRPSLLDDLGLEATLEKCADDFSVRFPETVVDVHFDVDGRLPPAIETTLYRIIQEALANAGRHGAPRSVDIVVVELDGFVRGIVEDDGRGFDVERARSQRNSVGIHAMRERAELLGGTLEIESGARGTTVVAEVPR